MTVTPPVTVTSFDRHGEEWRFPVELPLLLVNVLITPHTGGSRRRYEENLIDILLDSLDRLWQGKPELYNQVV